MSKQEAARKAASKPSAKRPAKAALAVITFSDPRTGEEYMGCAASLGEAGDCHRGIGHKGGHRVSRYKADDPSIQAKRAASAVKRDAWNALTPEQQEAERAARQAHWANLKAEKKAAKVMPPKASPVKSAAKRNSRVMNSGAVPRTTRGKAAQAASAPA